MREQLSDAVYLKNIVYLLWSKKIMLLGLSFILLGVVYYFSLFIQPVFEARVTIFPPAQPDIAVFNMDRTSLTALHPINATEQYNFLRGMLISPEHKMKELADGQDKFKVDYTFLPHNGLEFAVTGSNASEVKSTLLTLLASAEQKTFKSLNEALLKELNALKKKISKGKMTLTNKNDKNDRKIKEKIIQDAYKIASMAGINTVTAFRPVKDFVVVNSNYLRGTKALAAELNGLQEGEVDPEKFVKLEKLQDEYDSAKAMLPITDGAVFYKRVTDEVAVKQIYSRRKSFLIFSFLTGLILICSAIIFLNMDKLVDKSFKKEKSSKSER